MSISRKLMSNAVYLFIDMFIINLLGFIFWFIVGRFYLPEQAGIIATADNLAVFLASISILGFGGALAKLIPEFLERKQYGKVVSLIRFSSKIILTSNIIIVLILFLFFPFISSITKLPIDAFILSVLILLSISFSNLSIAITQGFQYMKKYFKSDLISSLVKISITPLLIFLGFNYIGPLIGILLCFTIIDLMRFSKSWFFSHSDIINKKEIFFNYSFPSFITTITSLAFSNFQVILLAFMENQSTTGLFAFAFLITSVVSLIPAVLAQALFPITSLLSVGNRIKKQCRLIELVFRYAMFMIIPASILLVSLSKPIMLLMRPEYLGASSLFPLLTLASMFFGLGSFFLANLYAIGKTKLNRNIWIFLSIIFLIIAPIMTMSYSSQGLAISYLISSVIAFVMSYYFIKKTLKLKIQWRNLIKIIVSGAIFLLFILIADFSEVNLPIKILIVLLGFASYLLILIPLRFYKREDVRIISILAEKSPIFKKQLLFLAKFLSKNV